MSDTAGMPGDMSVITSPRVAVYSAIYAEYERPKPLPPDLGVPAVLYTDSSETARLAEMLGWEAILAPGPRVHHWFDPKATPGMMEHKWWKCHPHYALPEMDISIWVDGQIEITRLDFVELCVKALGEDDWTAVKHPYRDCIYSEANFSATLARYDEPTLDKQTRLYWNAGHPKNWGLFATGANVRRHNAVTRVMGERWWDECLLSHQDQISLPVLFRLAGDAFKWNTNMPWWEWWTIHPHGS